MNKFVFTFFCLTILYPTLSQAMDCAPIEYVELKDMNKEKLIIKYCAAKDLLTFNNMQIEAAKMSPYRTNLDSYIKGSRTCAALSEKIETAYEAKTEQKIPECLTKFSPN